MNINDYKYKKRKEENTKKVLIFLDWQLKCLIVKNCGLKQDTSINKQVGLNRHLPALDEL